MKHLLNKTYFGDCRESLKMLIDVGVRINCCITSPPYFGLRSYLPDDHPDKALEIGTEKTPEEYIARLLEMFRLVRKLLTPDGILFIVISDSRNGSGGAGGEYGPGGKREGQPKYPGIRLPQYKPKDLIGIPWMLAFALRNELGLYLRSDIIWAKGVSGQEDFEDLVYRSCIGEGLNNDLSDRIVDRLNLYIGNGKMESVKDRPTMSHEYVFMLSKNRHYYYDADAIAEPIADCSWGRYQRAVDNEESWDPEKHKSLDANISQSPMKILTRGAKSVIERGTRNRRSVVVCPTQSYAGAHFACFPEALIEPFILAGCPEGGTVLDPFIGSGTTAHVCEKLGRNWIGCELNENYESLQKGRLQQTELMSFLNEVE